MRGEHDISTVPVLSSAMARAMSLDESDVVVDLSDVEFMDASTIGVILRTREFLRPRSRAVFLRAPSPSARRILNVSGLADVFDPPADPPGALATWVAVPVADRPDRPDRPDRRDDTPAPAPASAGRAAP
jgi:stage II sporulation protein AA (anti-sigma F factor antagonist)